MRFFHPRRAARSCDDCIKYRYGDDEKPLMRAGKPLERSPGDPLPCDSCPKIADGDLPHPGNAQDFSPKNLEAFHHWQECEAVNWQGCIVDPIVKRNAAILKGIYEEYRLRPITELAAFLPLVAAAAPK